MREEDGEKETEESDEKTFTVTLWVLELCESKSISIEQLKKSSEKARNVKKMQCFFNLKNKNYKKRIAWQSLKLCHAIKSLQAPKKSKLPLACKPRFRKVRQLTALLFEVPY